MKMITWEIPVNREQIGYEKRTPAASITGYLLDAISVAPDRKRPAVIICPGGGYEHLSDREGEPVALQMTAMGYHAFVLRYSLAPDHFPTALMELASAVAEVRARSGEWGIDSKRILVCGFSAGGHLAGSLGAFWNREFLYRPLGREPEQIRPDGMILGYPVVTAGALAHRGSVQNLLGEKAEDAAWLERGSLEKQVGPHTPKTFLWHTASDQSVPALNSMLLAGALLEQGVNVEFHLYPAGCHGLSLATAEVSGPDGRYEEPQCQSWISLLKIWMEHFDA